MIYASRRFVRDYPYFSLAVAGTCFSILPAVLECTVDEWGAVFPALRVLEPILPAWRVMSLLVGPLAVATASALLTLRELRRTPVPALDEASRRSFREYVTYTRN